MIVQVRTTGRTEVMGVLVVALDGPVAVAVVGAACVLRGHRTC